MNLHLKISEKNLSQRELSRLTGIRQATISAYCNNTFVMISKEHLDTFCKFFNCKIEELIEYINEEKAED